MAKTWIFQELEDIRRLGDGGAPWQVGFIDLEGKRRKRTAGPGDEGRRKAERMAAKIEDKIETGQLEIQTKKTWKDFRSEYESRVLSGMSLGTQAQTKSAMDSFQKLIKPGRMIRVNTAMIDEFISKLRREPGKRAGERMSVATINKKLRTLKAVLAVAEEYRYLRRMPKFRFEKEVKKLPRYITEEHFLAVYNACDSAKRPELPNTLPADWWRAFVVFAYMTGWRVNEILSMESADCDLEKGYAITRGDENKGRRDEKIPLHAMVIEHLEKLNHFAAFTFPWPHNLKTLYVEFKAIQEAAGIHLPCRKKHEHTPSCHYYGFHDFRRAFATLNAANLTPDALQQLMRHQSYQTTQVYINMAKQMDEVVNKLHAPTLNKRPGETG